MLHIRRCDRVISHCSLGLASLLYARVASLEHILGIIISSCATVFTLWWYFASCWLGYHLLCLSEVEVGGHHEDLAVSLQDIVAAVRRACADAMFLGEIATVMCAAIYLNVMTAVLTSFIPASAVVT